MSAKNIAKNVMNKGNKVVSYTGDAAGTMTGDGGKSLFFIIMSCICLWLILDVFYGPDYIGQLIDKMFGR